MNPLIRVHRKFFLLPGWIKEVVMSNIRSKPFICGYCYISLFGAEKPLPSPSLLVKCKYKPRKPKVCHSSCDLPIIKTNLAAASDKFDEVFPPSLSHKAGSRVKQNHLLLSLFCWSDHSLWAPDWWITGIFCWFGAC